MGLEGNPTLDVDATTRATRENGRVNDEEALTNAEKSTIAQVSEKPKEKTREREGERKKETDNKNERERRKKERGRKGRD